MALRESVLPLVSTDIQVLVLVPFIEKKKASVHSKLLASHEQREEFGWVGGTIF